MDLAHPVLPAHAIPALPAGDYLLGDDLVTDGEAVSLSGSLAQGNYLSDKLMARDHWRLAVSFPKLITPEERCAAMTLHIAGTYTGAKYPSNDLAGACLRYRCLFQPIVLWTMTHDSSHGFGQIIHND
jgi:hypothetical protein